jgi:hypothetical protein
MVTERYQDTSAMPPFDVRPRDLMAALDAFAAERKLQSQGSAIRVLLTETLEKLGYLIRLPGSGVRPGRPIHRSSNGDDWLLADDGGSVMVIHRANPSSGGTVTTAPIEEFLERNGDSPEAKAVRSAMADGRPSDLGPRG